MKLFLSLAIAVIALTAKAETQIVYNDSMTWDQIIHSTNLWPDFPNTSIKGYNVSITDVCVSEDTQTVNGGTKTQCLVSEGPYGRCIKSQTVQLVAPIKDTVQVCAPGYGYPSSCNKWITQSYTRPLSYKVPVYHKSDYNRSNVLFYKTYSFPSCY